LLIVSGYDERMKLTVQVQLIPDSVQAKALRDTVERFNEAANWVAGVLFARRVSNKRLAQKLVYRELRDRFGLTA
jgi:putative transposase